MDTQARNNVIEIATFFVAALIAFLSYSSGDTLGRILFAIPVGIVFLVVSVGVLRCIESYYWETADVIDIIIVIFGVVVLPVLFFYIMNNYNRHSSMETKAWLALVFSTLIICVVIAVMKGVVELFRR